jgi:hypothetical protein
MMPWRMRGWKNSTALAAVEKKGKFPKGLSDRSRIDEASGRFLTQESGVWWMEANDDVTCEKVTHSFRNRRNVAEYKKKEGKATGVVRPGHFREF